MSDNIGITPVYVRDSLESAGLGLEQVEQRTQFIKRHLDSMSDDEQMRFEFFVRSHFRKKYIKEVLRIELGKRNNL